MVANLTHRGRVSFEKLSMIISLLSMCLECESSRCEGFFKGCCFGFFWNTTTQQCERCMAGYSGENCSLPCPYPYYGVECQRKCNCSRDLCDVGTGCTEMKMTTAQTTSRGEKVVGLSEETFTFIAAANSTVSTNENQETNETQHLMSVNNQIILCIKIFGCVDILLILTYSAVYIYDRQHRSVGVVDTYERVSGINSAYENAEIFFLSAPGNQLL